MDDREASSAARRTRNPEQVRGRILDAAKEFFSRLGYDDTALRPVAERAGVKLPLLLYHFGSKENLWRSVIDEVATRRFGIDPLADAEGSSSRGRLSAFIEHTTRRFAAEPSLHLLISREGHRHSDRLKWLVDTYMHDEYDLGKSLIVACQRDGVVKPSLDPGRTLFSIYSIVAGFFESPAQFESLAGVDAYDEIEIRRTIAFLEELIFT